ncbi:MAG: DNA mismatch repair protein MutT [Sphingomonadales bacterium 32-68-7]|nr:MAG: DNA mismatch repair protein MutT [Sphingomonadales bacterium 12-68-11]OYX10361.1 MAG: DNA mismatch repair protein MutT [Sphingomonadales bacterium 32-68-7]
MTVWTPPAEVVVKVIGLVWRDNALLLAEVEDSAGRLKGLRPLGGSVEFGETREQALHREFAEELGCGITVIGPWHSFENIYQHEGATGHEYIFAAAVRLEDDALYRQERIAFLENQGARCHAVWRAPADLPSGVDLYPGGLSTLIDAGKLTLR